MKKLFFSIQKSLAIFTLALFSLSAQSQVTDKQIYQLLDKSGATRTIEGLPAQMQMMGQQLALTTKDQAEHQQVMQLLMSATDTDAMLQTMVKHIRSNIGDAELKDIFNWLDSDLAKQVIQAELQSTEPNFQQELLKYISDLQANPPSPQRTAAVVNFVESSGIVEQSMAMVLSMVDNMFGAMKALNPEDTEAAAMLDAQLSQMEAVMKPSLEQQMILTSYYVYRDISDENLASYTEFYQSETGKKYLSLLIGAIGESMGMWGTNLIKHIEKEVKQ